MVVRLVCIIVVFAIRSTQGFISSNHGCQKQQSSRHHHLKTANIRDVAIDHYQPFRKTLVQMFCISAPLGTILDNQHGLFNVLNYNEVSIPITIVLGNGVTILKTASFVPLLFGIAGVVMAAMVLFLDKHLPSYGLSFKKIDLEMLSWPNVFYGISFFSLQYYLSGYLDNIHMDDLAINVVLGVMAIANFAYFDSSTAGLLVSIATAIAGPAAEIFLINVLHLYSYTNGNFFGVCSWIYAVYFCGGFAVSNLSRKLFAINSIYDDDEESDVKM